jgi:hypothetical protein
LNQSYKVLLHKSFTEQSKAVCDKYPKVEASLVSALQEIAANPIPGAMRNIGIPELQGVIHKKHVGGRRGHRLIYLHPLRSNIIIPVFVSPEPKPPFQYEDVDWEGLCDQCLQDYKNKNYDAFQGWNG